VSGIAAIFERDGAPVGTPRIAAMLGRLRRRGPDRDAHHVEGPAALAQAMFETTPEDAFDRQPRRSRSRSLWIVADARIDNRRELLGTLAEPGEAADRIPDSELILRAYERWGEACPARLIGDFAFAIWDAEQRRLFCARDHLGIRMLYYQHDTTSFRCATEMDVLFADERVTRRAHLRSVTLFLAYQYAERDETLYEGVRAVPPGHALTVTATSIRCTAYWRPDPSRTLPPAGDDAYAERFREIFSEAVRCRLRSNRPVAADVSGGLDSSSVACEGERLRRAGIVTGPALTLLRAAFPGMDCDEQPYSQAVADHLGLPIETCYPTDQPDLCRPGQPYPDLYSHPTLATVDPLLDDLGRRGLRVGLTGFGGDLLMQQVGYEFTHHLRERRVRAALRSVGLDRSPLSKDAWRRAARETLWTLLPVAARRLREARFPLQSQSAWLSPSAVDLIRAHVAQEDAAMRSLHPDPHRATLCRAVTHWPGTLLPMVAQDRAGAAHAFEFRHPLFDVRLVELLLALPLEQRFTCAQTKGVLRRAMGSALPTLVRERTGKANFASYIQRMFLDDQRGALQHLFQTSHLVEQGLVDAHALRKLLASPSRKQFALIDLTAMEVWLRTTQPPIVQPASPPASQEDRHEHA